jgi:hypothetical protein
MIYKTLHRKLKKYQHETTKTGCELVCFGRVRAVPVPLVAPAMFPLLKTWRLVMNEERTRL